MIDKLDCVVVGAGVVGLAVARELAAAGREVVVLEAESSIGMHSSSRNSEVIHAGIYYRPGSLKALLCVAGRQLLYDYCQRKGVAARAIGKFIVASDAADVDRLYAIRENAENNGVTDLAFVDAERLRKQEPNVAGVAAIWSPSTGIVDSHALMLALQGDIEAADGVIILNSPVQRLQPAATGIDVVLSGDAARYRADTVVNAAGLGAMKLAGEFNGGLAMHPAKGHYFAYTGTSPFAHLIYPLPTAGGLGIHATLDMAGAVRFGPDVGWIDSVDYDFDESRKSAFVAAIRQYFPTLDESRLAPAYTGVRPKLGGPEAKDNDFVIQGEDVHGIPQLLHLFGIESPGLTSSLAIAQLVRDYLGNR